MQILTSIPRRIGFGAPLFVIVVLLVLSSAVFFWKLGVKPLENWDEGIHAEVTREVLANKAWLSLSYRDDYYTAKPPLKFWLTAPLFAIGGATEFYARFWSAVAGVLTTMLIGWWAFQWNRSVRFALLTGGIFLFGRFVMYHAFRTGETDGLLVLFVTAAMYAYWKLQDDQRWLIVFGAMTGLAIMTKSVGGFIPLMVAAVDLTLSRGWRTITRRMWLLSIATAAIIALPWHLLELLRHGREFIDGYIGFNVVQRSGDVLYANDVPWWWYADIIIKRMIPFGSFLPLALILAIRRMRRGRDVLDRVMIVWAVVVFAVFSLVQTKFDWYVLPLYVPLAFLLARAFSEFLHQDRDRFLLITSGLSFAVFVFRIPLEFVAQGWLWRLTPYAYVPSGLAGTDLGRGLIALATTAGVGFLIWALRKRLVIASTRAIGMIIVVYLCVLASGWQFSYLRHLPTTAPLKTIAEKVEALGARSIDVVGINMATQPAGNFYLQRIADLEVREIKADQPRQSELILTTVENRPNDAKNAILEVGPFGLYSTEFQDTL